MFLLYINNAKNTYHQMIVKLPAVIPDLIGNPDHPYFSSENLDSRIRWE